MTSNQRGFTLIEVLVAVVVLSIGLLALGGATGRTTRTLYGSRLATVGSQVAAQRLDKLRAAAASTFPRCTAPAFSSSSSSVTTYGVTETWVVPASGSPRVVRSIVAYPIGAGRTKTDTAATSITC